MRPPLALSNSKMKALNCPRQYQHRYLNPSYREYNSTPARKGLLGHEVAERYIPELARRNRSSDMDAYSAIILELTANEPEWIAQSVLDVGERFVSGFKLDKKADSHETEALIVLDRNYQPTENFTVNTENARQVIPVDEDILSCRIDYRAVYKGGKKSAIWDFKMGEEHVSPDSARSNAQLQLYAAMDFWANPEREKVTVVLWGVKYGVDNRSSWEYTREGACEPAQARVERSWAKLDWLYDNWPEDVPWIATPDVYSTCQFCAACAICPHNLSVMAQIIDLPLFSKPRKRKSA